MFKIIQDTNHRLHIGTMILMILLITAFCVSIGNATRLNKHLEEQQEINAYLTYQLDRTQQAIEILAEREKTNTDVLNAFKEYYADDKEYAENNYVTQEDLSLEVERQIELHKGVE